MFDYKYLNCILTEDLIKIYKELFPEFAEENLNLFWGKCNGKTNDILSKENHNMPKSTIQDHIKHVVNFITICDEVIKILNK